MMIATGSDVETFIIEDDQVIFSTKFGRHAHQIRDFVLAQPECVKLDWDLDHFEGPALTPEWKVKNEAKLAKLAVGARPRHACPMRCDAMRAVPCRAARRRCPRARFLPWSMVLLT